VQSVTKTNFVPESTMTKSSPLSRAAARVLGQLVLLSMCAGGCGRGAMLVRSRGKQGGELRAAAASCSSLQLMRGNLPVPLGACATPTSRRGERGSRQNERRAGAWQTGEIRGQSGGVDERTSAGAALRLRGGGAKSRMTRTYKKFQGNCLDPVPVVWVTHARARALAQPYAHRGSTHTRLRARAGTRSRDNTVHHSLGFRV
jgi:hypothetical protein